MATEDQKNRLSIAGKLSKLQRCRQCHRPSLTGFSVGNGLCMYHWLYFAWGEKWADECAERIGEAMNKAEPVFQGAASDAAVRGVMNVLHDELEMAEKKEPVKYPDVEALKVVIAALEPLTPEGRIRVLAATTILLGLEEPLVQRINRHLL